MERHFGEPDEPRLPPTPSAEDARTALAHLDEDRAALAQRIVTPWWYHPALGVIAATFAGAHVLPGAGALMAIALGVVAIPTLMSLYARQTGVVVTKPAGPRSRRFLGAMLIVLVAAMVCALLFKLTGVDPLWGLAPAMVTFVATVILGRRYDDALRRETREAGSSS